MIHALILCVAAQSGDPLTLEDSVRQALGFHINVLAQRALVDDARSFDRQARTWPNPQFSAVAQDVGLVPPGPAPLVLQQSVAFPVMFMYTRMQEQRVASATVTHARAMVEEEQRQIRLQVGRTYFDLLLHSELSRIEADGVALAREQVRMTQQRVTDGDASALDVERARAEELDAERALEISRRREDILRLALSVLVGANEPSAVAVAEDWSAADRLLKRLPTLDDSTLPIRVLAGRPDVQMARAALQRAREQHVLESRRVMPLAELQLSVGARQSALGTGAVVGFTAPIPAFDRNQGPRERAHAAVNRAQANVAQAERQALLEMKTAMLLWRRAEGALQNWALPAVEARTHTLHGVEAQYAAGTVMLFDVIAARRDVLAARRAVAQTRFDAASAAWVLATALGLG